MNIETANRLLQYRKKSGLSQEELAEKIGVSRQAVSKWERAEASPDTDNLIILADIYGVTLDELLTKDAEKIIAEKKSENTSPASNENTTEKFNEQADNNVNEDKFSFKKGIHLQDSNGKVDISFKDGIHVHSNDGTKVDIDNNGVSVVDENGEQKVYTDENGDVQGLNCCGKSKSKGFYGFVKKFPYPIIAILGFFLFGHYELMGGYSTSWIWFLTIPLYYTAFDAIEKRNLSHFCYPVFVAMLYCFTGIYCDAWHPMWLLFLTIPVFYFVASFIKPKESGKKSFVIADDNIKKKSAIPVVISVIVSVVLLFSICFGIGMVMGKTETYSFVHTLNGLPMDNIVIDTASCNVNLLTTEKPYSYLEYTTEVRGLFNKQHEDIKIEKKDNATVIKENTELIFLGYKKINLNIYLTPQVYNSIAFNTTSGNITAECLQTNQFVIDGTSGDAKVSEIYADELSIDVTSGDITFEGAVKDSVKIDMTSGDVKFTSALTPNKLTADSTSGDIVISVPQSEKGFTLNYDKTSGSIKSDLPLVGTLDSGNGKAVYGEGRADFNIDITSGDVIINEAVPQNLIGWLYTLTDN